MNLPHDASLPSPEDTSTPERASYPAPYDPDAPVDPTHRYTVAPVDGCGETRPWHGYPAALLAHTYEYAGRARCDDPSCSRLHPVERSYTPDAV